MATSRTALGTRLSLVSRYATAGSRRDRFILDLGGIQENRRHFPWIFTSAKLKNVGFKHKNVDNYF